MNGNKRFRITDHDVEEIVPGDSSQTRLGDAVRNRYLHSWRDTARRVFVHADGALRMYDAAEYAPTRESPLAGRDRPIEQRRLWCADGELTDEQWSRLTGWFRQNGTTGRSRCDTATRVPSTSKTTLGPSFMTASVPLPTGVKTYAEPHLTRRTVGMAPQWSARLPRGGPGVHEAQYRSHAERSSRTVRRPPVMGG